jgi:hypothetical protein
MNLPTATPEELEGLRDLLVGQPASSLEEASQVFVRELVLAYPDLLLSRVFVMLPFETLPAPAAAFARRVAAAHTIAPRTPVLSLLGTHGREADWCDRLASKGHLAIPLVSQQFAAAIPMVSSLLASLSFDIAHLDNSGAAFTRRMAGGLNGAFYVRDARGAVDELKRPIISPAFVEAYGIRTVFGMGGPYFDGTLLAIISFSRVIVERPVIDRFATLISFFKMKTQDLVRTGRVFRDGDAPSG